jgi:hypothetical protein
VRPLEFQGFFDTVILGGQIMPPDDLTANPCIALP